MPFRQRVSVGYHRVIMRIVFAAALIAGISFYFVPRMLDAAWWIVWKTIGVALLASWAALQAHGRDGWLLVAVLAFGALGDALLETSGMAVGGAAFLIGHLTALALYLGNRRLSRGKAIAVTVVSAIAIGGTASGMTHDPGVGLYALGLGAMAGSALASRFPLAGVGAALFAFSDLMIFAHIGPLAGSSLPGFVIWPTYFAGQALVAISVARGLREPRGTTI